MSSISLHMYYRGKADRLRAALHDGICTGGLSRFHVYADGR